MDVSKQVAWRPNAYAGFWQRFGGFFIDGLLILVVQLVLALIATAIVGRDVAGPAVRSIVFAAAFAYDTVLTHRFGATLGKRAAGTEVRMPDGTLPSYGVCAGRFFARVLSGLPFLLGFVWTAFDPKKQTWHDKIVSTVVIRRADAVNPGDVSTAGPPSVPGWSQPAGAPAWGGSAPASAAPSWGRAPGGSPVAQPSPQQSPDARGGPVGETMETARWGRPSDAAPTVPAEAPTAVDAVDAAPTRPQEGRPDPNLVAIQRAGLDPGPTQWLEQVAGQVDPRLDLVSPTWRQASNADAARACAFGVLIGHLARLHPQMGADLSRVAEVHPSFSTLVAGSRLATLTQISGDLGRATAWLGPLVDVEDQQHIAKLLG